MSTIAELEGKSLEDIIKSNKKVRGPKKPQQKGPERRKPKERDSPYSSSSPSDGKWKHDKAPEKERKPKRNPPVQKSEEELGYKVKITNSPLTEEEYKALLEGSEIKFIRIFAAKKFASIFFAKKEDAEKAINDYNNTELLDGTGNSVWEYVPWTAREPRSEVTREPREPRRDSRPQQNKQHNNPRKGGAPTGGRINPHDVVITVRK